MSRVKKLTPNVIKKIIAEEKARLTKLGLIINKDSKKNTSRKKIKKSSFYPLTLGDYRLYFLCSLVDYLC